MLLVKGTVFFRADSQQLYGVQYLSNNRERFIERNTENSWVEYTNNMSMQGR